MPIVWKPLALWGLPAWGVGLVLGMVLGSFTNAAVWRLPRGENLATAHSRCVVCATPLGALDLLPVLGWFLLRGRCRYCHAPVSWRYPFHEALVGMCFALSGGLFAGPAPGLLAFWWGAAMLWVVARVDAVTGLVFPGFLAWTWAVGAGIMALTGAHGPWGGHVLGAALAGGGFFAVMWLASALMGEEAMGLGDVVLAAWIGWFLGPGALVVWVMGAFLLGAALGLPWFVWRLKTGVPDARRIPFGPFMALSAVLVWLGGRERLADWLVKWAGAGVY